MVSTAFTLTSVAQVQEYLQKNTTLTYRPAA